MALAPDARTAPQAAGELVDRLGPDGALADAVARQLDRVAFDPDHHAGSDERAEVARSINRLEALSGKRSGPLRTSRGSGVSSVSR